MKRLKLRKSLNRYDKFKSNFYQKVQNGFLNLSKKKDKKYLIIDSNLSKKENKIKIIKKIEKLI